RLHPSPRPPAHSAEHARPPDDPGHRPRQLLPPDLRPVHRRRRHQLPPACLQRPQHAAPRPLTRPPTSHLPPRRPAPPPHRPAREAPRERRTKGPRSSMSDKTEHPPVPEAFAALGIRPSLLRALAEASFTTPSEIQTLLIPRALAGVDILGQARTGTGKTAAFGIPILQKVDKGIPTQAIILVPTRELAMQVEVEIQRLGQCTPIRTCAVYGGQKI